MNSGFSQSYFVAPTSGDTLFTHIILYDSQPFECYLAKDQGAGKAAETTYEKTGGFLNFKNRPHARAIKMISACTTGCSMKVEVEELTNGPTNDRIDGFIDPVRIWKKKAAGYRHHIETFTFDTPESAGDFFWTSSLHKHIAVFGQINGQIVQEPRFSASVVPFYRKSLFDPADADSQPEMGVYGNGFLCIQDEATAVTLEPFQNTPLMARPITGDAEKERGLFHAIANSAFHATGCGIVAPYYNNNTNYRGTNIAFYRQPLIFYPNPDS